MPFPQFPRKHLERPLYGASEYREYVARRAGPRLPRCPRNVVLVIGRRWRRYLTQRVGAPILPEYDLYRVGQHAGVSAITGPGAPCAALYVEELVALGTRRFLLLGMAGSLQETVRVGSLVVCSKALRDEGTSHHYVGPGRFAYPSPRLLTRLRATLDQHPMAYVAGPTWTTDAPYRETRAEVRRYREQGILTVEMEASGVFSVAQTLGAEAAALFVVSDHVGEGGWEPRFHECWPRMRRTLPLATRAVST